MERKEAIKTLLNYCTRIGCVGCPLKSKPWSSEISPGCPDFHKISDDELYIALEIFRTTRSAQENDPVNKPAHYTDGKIEVIDFIEDKKLGFCLENAVKYIARAGKKDPSKEIEDLKKAEWYIKRRIRELEGAM